MDPYTVNFQIQPPLTIPDNSCCALTQASFAFSQPNIAFANQVTNIPNGNNRISLQIGTANPWLDVTLPTGLYDYFDVQSALNQYVRIHDVNGLTVGAPIISGPTDLFLFSGIAATQKLIITLNPAGLAGGVFPAGGLSVSFANPSPSLVVGHALDSIGPVLGYPTTGVGDSFVAPAGSNAPYSSYAPQVAGFSNTSAYTLYMSLVTASYQNGIAGQLLYSFPLGTTTANSVVAYQPTLRFPVSVNAGSYSTVTVWTADQAGNRFPWAYYQSPFQFSAIISKNKEDGSL